MRPKPFAPVTVRSPEVAERLPRVWRPLDAEPPTARSTWIVAVLAANVTAWAKFVLMSFISSSVPPDSVSGLALPRFFAPCRRSTPALSCVIVEPPRVAVASTPGAIDKVPVSPFANVPAPATGELRVKMFPAVTFTSLVVPVTVRVREVAKVPAILRMPVLVRFTPLETWPSALLLATVKVPALIATLVGVPLPKLFAAFASRISPPEIFVMSPLPLITPLK